MGYMLFLVFIGTLTIVSGKGCTLKTVPVNSPKKGNNVKKELRNGN